MKTAGLALLIAVSMLPLRAAEASDSDRPDDAPAPPVVMATPADTGTPVESAAVISGKFEALPAVKDTPDVVGTFSSKSGIRYFVLAAPELLKKLNSTSGKNITVRGRMERKNTLKIEQVLDSAPAPTYRKRAGF